MTSALANSLLSHTHDAKSLAPYSNFKNFTEAPNKQDNTSSMAPQKSENENIEFLYTYFKSATSNGGKVGVAFIENFVLESLIPTG